MQKQRDADYSFFAEYPPHELGLTKKAPSKFRQRVAIAAITLSAALMALPALAIPGSTQNPDGSWSGPDGENLGGGNPPAHEQPSRERENEKGGGWYVVGCGDGWSVEYGPGVSRRQAIEACREFKKLGWPDGVNPGDKG